MNESLLLAKARQLEPQALIQIYDRYSDEIYRYAMRLSGNPDLAEECVAETFARLLESFRRGAGPRNFLRAYLYRIAHNWLTDFFRAHREDVALEKFCLCRPRMTRLPKPNCRFASRPSARRYSISPPTSAR